MSKIVINLGHSKKVDDLLQEIKAFLLKKKKIEIVVVGEKKDITLLSSEDCVRSLINDKSYLDIEDESEFSSTSLAVSYRLLKDWDADVLVSFEGQKEAIESAKNVLAPLPFLKTVFLMAFLTTSHRPLALADWNYLQEPTIEDIKQIYDLLYLASRRINQIDKPRLAVLSENKEGDYPVLQEFLKEMKKMETDNFVGTVPFSKVFQEDKADAFITCYRDGEIMASAAYSGMKAYVSLFETLATKGPLTLAGMNFCRKVTEASIKQLDFKANSACKLLLGLEKPVVYVTDLSFQSATTAMSIAHAIGLNGFNEAIYDYYDKEKPTRLSDDENKAFLEKLESSDNYGQK